jgi:hypothetical protein
VLIHRLILLSRAPSISARKAIYLTKPFPAGRYGLLLINIKGLLHSEENIV